MIKSTDIRILEVRTDFADHAYRSPIKFGGRTLDRATVLDVTVRVRSRDGREARGFGSMPLGATWSFPSARLDYARTLGAMRELAGRVARRLTDAAGGDCLDPFEHGEALERLALAEAGETGCALELGEPVPKLCALVAASPFDAAVHDAFGKLLGRSVWSCYGPEHLNRDLAGYLDAAFAGEHPGRYLSAEPKPRMPLYHLVGALDPLTPAEVARPVGDGLPEHLGEWIARDGLTHLKIKLGGEDLGWDVGRVLAVDRVAAGAAPDREWRYSLDFNEKCADAGYLLEFIERVGESAPAALARVQYIEQPTARDLAAHPGNRVHAAARIKPVVIDESLTGYDALLLAREMGYSGAALKSCKGQSQAVLMAAAAARFGMFLCVQDLTCPGASFLHSAALAAHVPGAAGVEGNARQYCPAANAGWTERFPGVFAVRDGTIETGAVTGPGLGCVSA